MKLASYQARAFTFAQYSFLFLHFITNLQTYLSHTVISSSYDSPNLHIEGKYHFLQFRALVSPKGMSFESHRLQRGGIPYIMVFYLLHV